MPQPTAYQRVTNAFDVTEAGVNTCHYCQYDGSDDGMVTNSIDFTATDKMSVFAGVRKLSDSNFAVIAELTAEASLLPGSWTLIGSAATSGAYLFGGRGTAQLERRSDVLLAPRSNVLTGLYNIGGSTVDEEISARINGTATALTTYSGTSLGSGNYANDAIYLGRRGGSSAPFNGRDYGIIVTGKLANATAIATTEMWLANKTAGVTL